MTIRIRKKIDSETLHLPELRQLIGKVVDITVEEEASAPVGGSAAPVPMSREASEEFWNPPSLEEIMRRQGKVPGQGVPFEELLGSFNDQDFEGFDEWLEETRRQPWRSEEID
jgi:hypothetical protein